MTALFDKSKKFALPVERKYGNPFTQTAQQSKMSELAKWEFMAGKIKKSTNTPTPVADIAAELFNASEKNQTLLTRK